MRSWLVLIVLVLACLGGYAGLNSCAPRDEPDFDGEFVLVPDLAQAGGSPSKEASSGALEARHSERARVPVGSSLGPTPTAASQVPPPVAVPPLDPDDDVTVPIGHAVAPHTQPARAQSKSSLHGAADPKAMTPKDVAPGIASANADVVDGAFEAPVDVGATDLPEGRCELNVHVPASPAGVVEAVSLRTVTLGVRTTSARSLLSHLFEGGAAGATPARMVKPLAEIARFEDLPAGVYQVAVRWRDGVVVRETIALAADRITRETRILRPKSLRPLRGRVVMTGGRPFVGNVMVMPRASQSSPYALLDHAIATRTNARGKFALPHVEGRDVVVSVRISKHVRVFGHRRLLPVIGTYELEVPALPHVLQGRVTDAVTGEPLAAAQIQGGSGDFETGLCIVRTATDAQGRYALPWRAARGGLFVSADGYAPSMVGHEALMAGAARLIKLEEGANVFGFVRRGNGTQVVADVPVHVMSQENQGDVMGAEKARSAVTDSEGHFLVASVPPGAAWVVAHSSAMTSIKASDLIDTSGNTSKQSSMIVGVETRGRHEQTLAVVPTALAEGLVVDHEGMPVPSTFVRAIPGKVPAALTSLLQASSVTDARGRFRLTGLVEGVRYMIRIEGDRRASQLVAPQIVATRARDRERIRIVLPAESRHPVIAQADPPPKPASLGSTPPNAPAPRSRETAPNSSSAIPPIAARTAEPSVLSKVKPIEPQPRKTVASSKQAEPDASKVNVEPPVPDGDDLTPPLARVANDRPVIDTPFREQEAGGVASSASDIPPPAPGRDQQAATPRRDSTRARRAVIPRVAIPRAATPRTVERRVTNKAAAKPPVSPKAARGPATAARALTIHVDGLSKRSDWVHLQLLRTSDRARLRAALRPGASSVTFKRILPGEHYTLWAPLGNGQFLYHNDVWGNEGELRVAVATGKVLRGKLSGALPPRHRFASVSATRVEGTPLRISGRVDVASRECVVEGVPPGTWRMDVEVWDEGNQRVRGSARIESGGTAQIELTGS